MPGTQGSCSRSWEKPGSVAREHTVLEMVSGGDQGVGRAPHHSCPPLHCARGESLVRWQGWWWQKAQKAPPPGLQAPPDRPQGILAYSQAWPQGSRLC